jgi:hypothetical protein
MILGSSAIGTVVHAVTARQCAGTAAGARAAAGAGRIVSRRIIPDSRYNAITKYML